MLLRQRALHQELASVEVLLRQFDLERIFLTLVLINDGLAVVHLGRIGIADVEDRVFLRVAHASDVEPPLLLHLLLGHLPIV